MPIRLRSEIAEGREDSAKLMHRGGYQMVEDRVHSAVEQWRASMASPITNSAKRHATRRLLRVGLVAAGFLAVPIHGHAADDPIFRIEFKNGVMAPRRLEVPAKRRFKLELHNLGQSPAEFESRELRKEKVLAPGTSSILVIRTLDPGEYDFFDDFHPGAPPAVLVAK